MKIIRVKVIFLLVSFQALSQGEIIGNIYYQSSGWKPVEGVLVNANGSNGDYSKTNGDFLLKFPNFDIGQTVHPSIGENNIAIDGTGKEVELVNEKELEFVSIPSNPEKAPLKIIVCPKGARDIAARRYYGIIKNEIENELSLKRKEIKGLREKLGFANDLVAEREKKLSVYEKFNDSIKIYKEAFKIASINRDDSKKRVRNYLDALDAGISVKEARKELSTEKAYNEAIISIESIESSIKEIQINAENYSIQLEFDKAFAQYDTITKILSDKTINPLLLAGNLILEGNLAQQTNRNERAVKHFNSALDILNRYSQYENVKHSANYLLGISYTQIKDFENAEKVLLKALTYHESNDNIRRKNNLTIDLGLIYTALVELYSNQDDDHYRMETYCIKAMSPFIDVNPIIIGEQLSIVYSKLITSNILFDNYKKTNELIMSLDDILEKLYNSYPEIFLIHRAELSFLKLQYYVKTNKFSEVNLLLPLAISMYEKVSASNPEKYNIEFAESLLVLALVDKEKFIKEKNKDDKNKINKQWLSIIIKIEELLSIYDKSILKVRDLLEMTKALRFRYSSEYTWYKEKNIPKNLFASFIILQKQMQVLEYKINLSNNDPSKILEYSRIFVEYCSKIHDNYPGNQMVIENLMSSYNILVIAALDAKAYDLAIVSAKKTIELDKLFSMTGFMNLVLAKAYVLQNRLDEAWSIYKKYKNEPFPESNGFYKENFLTDIQDLESKGIHHKEFKKIKKFLQE